MSRSVRADPERGAGSVLVLMAVLVVVSVLGAALVLGEGYLARHRAAAAADLAALAAATALSDPALASHARACRLAEEVARANRAELLDCAVWGVEVEVLVEVGLSGPAAVLGDPRRRARAGTGEVPVR